jgi:toxin ParE1/3/4
MRIHWRRQAQRDLQLLRSYIARSNPAAATGIARRIRQAVDRLAATPQIGRPGRISGTRELVVAGTPYIVPYRIQGAEVQILRVYHARRRWPDRL